ncbi:MAG TPA: 2Fe-2S iron-sulfur cluster-binding protein [Anaerolineae bacterium]|jgi:sarcosine oxidase subunit alpha|nr:2Fe-2S iron-sulfur cluster-binding protein [Anaerolineae bacterium]
MTKRQKNRLSPQPGEVIDRDSSFSFSFDGQTCHAHPGDTIASALAAAGVKVFSRSFKYHRPRGLLCCAGQCPNCLVQVGDEPNVRACIRPVESAMKVRSQNAWPSLKRDVMSLTSLGDRFLPAGFYYKTFIRPQFLWPTFERMLRRAAGLGQVNLDTEPGRYDKEYQHADVVVVGGGPAGLSAAIAANAEGARVILLDENPALGGHLRFASPGTAASLPKLLEAIGQEPDLAVHLNTTVLSWYEDNWLSAAQQDRLFKIRAQSVIFATGAYEQPLLFDDNDLPGVLLASAVQRMINLYGVAPGEKALVVTANDYGWAVAADLKSAGLQVAAVVDERPASDSPLVRQVTSEETHAYWGHTIVAAKGSGEVSQAIISPVNGHELTGAEQMVDCDLIAVSVGWAPASGLIYQANGQLAFDRQIGEFLPQALPAGIFAAGRVAGTHELLAQLAEGRFAGREAAAFLELCERPSEEERTGIEAIKKDQVGRTSDLVFVPGKKKQFLCFCEDVTKKDLEQSIAEGYDSIELLKRYSTISMGPCQGKMCSLNTVHLCARANGQTIEETGTTTARPPMTPISLGVLAGQNMEPERISPVHEWQKRHGAKMMVAGLWKRPEHYGDPEAEVRAVRERVGLIDVSTLGKFRLDGPGVPDLLDRIYVNKWQNVAMERIRYGLMCNDEGIILDDGVTARVAAREWYMTTTSSGATTIYEWMQWWVQSGWGDGVNISDLSEVNAAFNLAGPKARQVLQTLVEADLSNEAFPFMHLRQVEVAGVPCRLLRIGFTGELSYEIHCPAGYGRFLWQAIMSAGEPFGITPFGVEAQRILRLEKAHIIVGQDTDALSDPISADMAWAVKPDKADFLGQRSLMRIAMDGQQQRLVGFRIRDGRTVPEEGLQIVEAGSENRKDIIGWVTSSRYSPTLAKPIGLCWLPETVAKEEGATFTIRRNGATIEAQVHHGPFYDPEGERLRS